jgi:hypothetical protein
MIADDRRTPMWLRVVIWLLAFLMMASAVIYQRLTGPTHPKRGTFDSAGESHRYRLIRSENTTTAARVRVPAADGVEEASVLWRRYPTEDALAPIPMTRDGADLVADLPIQPAAGKIEYRVEVRTADGVQSLPAADDTVILRYKDPVPGGVLIPHIVLMFTAVFFGIRTGLTALLARSGMRWSAWTALGAMTIGGLVLGPIVQNYAFGAYWTGWPFGGDLTDNKVAFMWIAWVIACTTIGFKPLKREIVGRVVVVAATIVMTGVYLIPHSMRGSELDYSKVDAGHDPRQAIGTSDE